MMKARSVCLMTMLCCITLPAIARAQDTTAPGVRLGLNYAAYESEIYRGALEAVPSGQLDAARTLAPDAREISSSTVRGWGVKATKVSDRGTGQAVGVVSDVGRFLDLLSKALP